MLFSRVRKIGKAVGHAQRLRVIVGVFLKFGYEDLVHQLPLPKLWRWLPTRQFRRQQDLISHHGRPERLRLAFEALGPAFVKLGQLLADRSRLLPHAYTEELAKLQDQVKPVPFSQVRSMLEKELRRPLEELYLEVDPEPLGSASIGQVHTARLRDGREVVVKVQRPGIEQVVRVDLELMHRLAELLEQHVEGWSAHHPTAIVAEFARRMESELDYTSEASAMERFAQQFSGVDMVRAPEVIDELSTRRVLTMERIRGIPASRVEELEAAGLDRVEISRRLAELTLRQVFEHGFLHADPHPGNVHILPGNVVCYLDFGMTAFLVRGLRDKLALFMAAILQKDEHAATLSLLSLAGLELDPEPPGLEADMSDFIHHNFSAGTKRLSFSRLLRHLFTLTSRHALTLPPEIFTVLKALGQTENLVRTLAPEEDMLQQASPFVKQMRSKRGGLRGLLQELGTFGSEGLHALRTLPMELRRIAAQVRGGKAKVTFRVEGLSPLNNTLERVTNRLAYAVVLGALLLASSIIIHAQVEPKWHGIPVLGLVGYLFAGLMGSWLMIAILRHGRM